MRQFDVFRNPSARSRSAIPYVVVLQSHFFEGVPTTIVAPMLPEDGRSAYTEASVKVAFAGSAYIVSIPELAGLAKVTLQDRAGELQRYEDELRRALDRLFTGF